ncbi:unnamed protein product [Discosporangium mesarthrocarpum]
MSRQRTTGLPSPGHLEMHSGHSCSTCESRATFAVLVLTVHATFAVMSLCNRTPTLPSTLTLTLCCYSPSGIAAERPFCAGYSIIFLAEDVLVSNKRVLRP